MGERRGKNEDRKQNTKEEKNDSDIFELLLFLLVKCFDDFFLRLGETIER